MVPWRLAGSPSPLPRRSAPGGVRGGAASVGASGLGQPARLRGGRGRATSEGSDLEALGEELGWAGRSWTLPSSWGRPWTEEEWAERALRGADGLEEGESLRPGFGSVEGLGFDGET